MTLPGVAGPGAGRGRRGHGAGGRLHRRCHGGDAEGAGRRHGDDAAMMVAVEFVRRRQCAWDDV